MYKSQLDLSLAVAFFIEMTILNRQKQHFQTVIKQHFQPAIKRQFQTVIDFIITFNTISIEYHYNLYLLVVRIPKKKPGHFIWFPKVSYH